MQSIIIWHAIHHRFAYAVATANFIHAACAVMVTHAAAPALKPSQPSVSQIRCDYAMAQLNQHECTVMDITLQLNIKCLKLKCFFMNSTQTSSKNSF